MFANPFYEALTTTQASFSIGDPRFAVRYPADVIPFLGLAAPSVEALSAARDLLAPAEKIWITAESLPTISGLTHLMALPCLQMFYPEDVPLPEAPTEADIEELSCANAQEMVDLTDVAFPGFFRISTCRLGRYFGIRRNGQLIAMAGERSALRGFAEVSAVCTHPEHTGKGYAAALIRQVIASQRERGLRSYLHLSAANTRAFALYQRLGFTDTAEIMVHQVQRS